MNRQAESRRDLDKKIGSDVFLPDPEKAQLNATPKDGEPLVDKHSTHEFIKFEQSHELEQEILRQQVYVFSC
jgi:hypothetical protein